MLFFLPDPYVTDPDRLPSPVQIIAFIATVLWANVAVQFFLWLRAIFRAKRNEHLGLFVDLMGSFVPVAAGLLGVILAGAFLGLPSAILFLAILVPGGLALTLNIEVARLAPTNEVTFTLRWLATLVLAAIFILLRAIL